MCGRVAATAGPLNPSSAEGGRRASASVETDCSVGATIQGEKIACSLSHSLSPAANAFSLRQTHALDTRVTHATWTTDSEINCLSLSLSDCEYECE